MLTALLFIASTAASLDRLHDVVAQEPLPACEQFDFGGRVPRDECRSVQLEYGGHRAESRAIAKLMTLPVTPACSFRSAFALLGWRVAADLFERIELSDDSQFVTARFTIDDDVRDAATAMCAAWDDAARDSPVAITIEVALDNRIVASFENRSAFPVSFALPGDGSDVALRTPHAFVDVTPADDLALATLLRMTPRPGGRCGNMNPLSASDVISLQPGERRRLRIDTYARVPGPGTWRLVLRYRSDPALLRMDHEGSAYARERVAATTRFTTVSAPMLIAIP